MDSLRPAKTSAATPASSLPGGSPATPPAAGSVEPGLTARLTLPTDTLPGDHGDRFGRELEQASARSVGEGAEGRRGERRAAERRAHDRTDRERPTEAREERRRSRTDRGRDREDLDRAAFGPDKTGPQDRTDRPLREAFRRRAGGEPTQLEPGRPIPTEAADDPAAANTGLQGAPATNPGAAAPAQGAARPTAGVEAVAAARPAAARSAPVAPQAPGAPRPAAGPEAPADAGPKGRPTPADAVGELLAEREVALEREAAILRQLKAQLAPGRRELTMRLDPAELGRLQLRLALRSGRLTATLRVESPEALDALQRQLPELAASLEDQGFEVQDFDLDLADPGDLDRGPDPRDPAAPAPAFAGRLADALAPAPTSSTASAAPRPAADPTSDLDLLA